MNKINQSLTKGKISVGGVVQIPSVDHVELMARNGFDFAWIDCEHGLIDMTQCIELIRTAQAFGITPLVRLRSTADTGMLNVLLDAGVGGLIAQEMETADEVRALAARMKYPPMGNRGACPGSRAYNVLGGNRSWDEYVEYSNKNTMFCPLIESRKGVDNIDSILDVPGIDMIVLGPFDLSHSLGYPGKWDHPEVITALTKVAKAAQKRGIPVMCVPLAPTPELLKEEVGQWIERGCKVVCATLDTLVLNRCFSETFHLLDDSFNK